MTSASLASTLSASHVDDHDNSNAFTVEAKQQLLERAKTAIELLLQNTGTRSIIPWRLIHENHGIAVFRSEIGHLGPCNVHAVSSMQCSIADILDATITDTTPSFQKMMKETTDDFVDGQVLQTLVPRSPEHPNRYIGIKWMARKSSTPFTKDKDYVFLEYADIVHQKLGHQTGFRVWQSIPSRHLTPPLEKYERSNLPLSGFVYSTKGPEEAIQVSYTLNFETELPLWAANTAIQSHVSKHLMRMTTFVETYQLAREEFASRADFIPLETQAECRICDREFHFLSRRKYNCTKCGHVLCGKCSSLYPIKLPVVGERQVRICVRCNLKARRTITRVMVEDLTSCSSASPIASPVSNRSLEHAQIEDVDEFLQTIRSWFRDIETQVTSYQSFVSRASSPNNLPEEEGTSEWTSDFVDGKLRFELKKRPETETRNTFTTSLEDEFQQVITTLENQTLENDSETEDEDPFNENLSDSETNSLAFDSAFKKSQKIILAAERTAELANKARVLAEAHFARHSLDETYQRKVIEEGPVKPRANTTGHYNYSIGTSRSRHVSKDLLHVGSAPGAILFLPESPTSTSASPEKPPPKLNLEALDHLVSVPKREATSASVPREVGPLLNAEEEEELLVDTDMTEYDNYRSLVTSPVPAAAVHVDTSPRVSIIDERTFGCCLFPFYK